MSNQHEYEIIGVRHEKAKRIAIFFDKRDAEAYMEDVWYNCCYYEAIYMVDNETGEVIAEFEE